MKIFTSSWEKKDFQFDQIFLSFFLHFQPVTKMPGLVSSPYSATRLNLCISDKFWDRFEQVGVIIFHTDRSPKIYAPYLFQVERNVFRFRPTPIFTWWMKYEDWMYHSRLHFMWTWKRKKSTILWCMMALPGFPKTSTSISLRNQWLLLNVKFIDNE